MNAKDVITILITLIGVASFAAIITILFKSYVNASIKEIRSGKRDIELIDEVLYEKQEKVIKKRKQMRILKKALFGVAFVFVVPLFIFSLIGKISGDIFFLNNEGLMVVASGSMSYKHDDNTYLVENNLNNQFSTYDIIYIKDVSNENELKLYDVIAFKTKQGKNIIHRIVEIIETDGQIKYKTQGDAIEEHDGFYPVFDDVIGVYTNKKIDGIGIIVLFLQSPSGIITIISIFYCLIILDKMSNKISLEEKDRLEKLENALKYNSYQKHDLKVEYKETIYYQGFAYEFDEKGFKEKREITDEFDPNKMIQVITDKNKVKLSSKEIDIRSEEE